MRTLGFALLALLATTACSHDSTTAPSTSNTANGYSITADSASTAQTPVVDSTVAVSVHVTKDSLPAAGIVVTWTVTGGHGTLSSTTSTTDATGAATVRWTMGDTASAYNTLTASISGAATSINLTSVGGTATSMKMVSADSQKVVAGATLPITVRAFDKFSNPSANTTVNWTTTAGTVSAPTSITGVSGNATTNFVTPTVAGTYKVTATIPGIGSIVYTVITI